MMEHPAEEVRVHSPSSEAASIPVAKAADPFQMLEAKMETMRNAIYAWKGRAESLQNTLSEREALAAAQQQQIEEMQEEIVRMQLALQQQQERVLHQENQLAEEQHKSAALEEQGASYLLQISEKEQQISEADAKILTLEQLAIRFEVQIQHMSNEQQQLESTLTGKEKNIADLEGYIALVEQENGALKQQLEQFTGANHQMMDRLNTMLDRFTSEADDTTFALPTNGGSGMDLYGATAGHA
jgi:chromosome segregation ATPase